MVLSSKGHYMHRGGMAFHDLHYQRRRYIALASYAQSKLANVLFASQLARCRKGVVSAYSQQRGRAQCYAHSLCLFQSASRHHTLNMHKSARGCCRPHRKSRVSFEGLQWPDDTRNVSYTTHLEGVCASEGL